MAIQIPLNPMNTFPFGLYLPRAWVEPPPPPSGPLLELPGVDYPRKIYFPAGRHSIVLMRTRVGIKWALVEDTSLPHIEPPLLRLILDCDREDAGVYEVFPPEALGISMNLCYGYISFEQRISRYVRSDKYNRFVVETLNERLEGIRRSIEALLLERLPPMCSVCVAMALLHSTTPVAH